MVWKISMHLSCMIFLFFSSLGLLIVSIQKLCLNLITLIEWEIFSLNSTSIVFTMIFDWKSLMFLSFVLLISSMVLYYSGGYMHGDFNFNRFMYLVLAFVFSMSMMILSPNLISILLGWDGLGLVSYALVIYYQNEKSSNAGMLTVMSNRIGDVAILLSIGLMFYLGGWNFLFYTYYLNDEMNILLKFLVVIAAMTKSAQIPFSAWLPAAMAAPTPVSALVHSSTLVTAGVYLMIRFSPALENSKSQSFLLIISCLTMFMAGLGANFEYDLKKIIALSTLSQLGVMLSILSLGFCDMCFFHLLTHALFKALLFMCAGSIIHNVHECQDIRYMGGLVKFLPLSVMYMSVANLALCGFPFLAGFYSKDLILETAFMSSLNMVSFVLYVFATGLTVCYTFRLIFYSLSGVINLRVMNCIDDNSNLMLNSMMSLGAGAIIMGSFLSWLIFPEPSMICLSIMMKSLVLVVSGAGAMFWLYFKYYKCKLFFKFFKIMFLYFFYSSYVIYTLFIYFKFTKINLKTGYSYYKYIDKGWSEFMGPPGLYTVFFKFFFFLNIMQASSIKVFMKMFMFLMIVFFFIYI
uniref:NADH-ubiquinone oxidoreductase chain 5 n=1 Tax=Moloha majora TaxID=405146 RepID=A0A0X9MBJ9_9EUCA|nr:NADH dehydrogenase subunit 5 [Moloha majora]ALZ50228.1 NADH dehydrogenase subunit 5 [Moloha majora]